MNFKPPKIFISHASEQNKIVEKISKVLDQYNIENWHDDKMNFGDNIIQEIDQKIKDASIFIILFSKDFISKSFPMTEYSSINMKYIKNKGIRIIPILIDISFKELPSLITSLYALKLQNRDSINESEIKKIIDTIKNDKYLKVLQEYQNNFYDIIDHIDIGLQKEKPSRDEIEYILEKIKDERFFRYFIKSEKIVNKNWFNLLNKLDYFNPAELYSKNNGEKIYLNIYPYLSRLSYETIVKKIEFEKEVLNIVKNHIDYIKNKKLINNINSYVIYNFIEIISNIKVKTLKEFLIENRINLKKNWLNVFLSSNYDKDLIGDGIIELLWPKFVEMDNKKYLNQIIDTITDLENKKIIKNPNTIKYIGDKNKKQTKISYYYIKKFFVENIDTITEIISKNTISKICKKLEKSLNHDNKVKTTYFTIDTLTFIFKVEKMISKFKINLGIVEEEEIKKIDLLLNNKIKDTIDFDVEKNNNMNENIFVEKVYDAISKKQKNRKGLKLLIDNRSDVKKELIQLYDLFNEDYSTIWHQNIKAELNDKIVISGASEEFVLVLKLLFLKLSNKNPEMVIYFLEQFLNGKYIYPIFTRIALYIIYKNWDLFKDLFFDFINKNPECFVNYNYELELLLITSSNRFNHSEIQNVKKIIEGNLGLLNKKIDKEYWKERWFKQNNNLFDLIEQSGQAYPVEPVSPIDYSELAKLQNNKLIVEKLNNQKLDSKEWSFDKKQKAYKEINEEGLRNEIQNLVNNYPNKIIDDLSPFLNLNYNCLIGLIDGLKLYVDKNNDIRFAEIVDFIKQLSERTKYIWEDAEKYNQRNFELKSDWLFKNIFELIEKMTVKEKKMPVKYVNDLYKSIEKIYNFLMSENYKYKEKMLNHLTTAINTSYGRGIMALISVVLHAKRNNAPIDKWKSFYSRLLKNNIVEAYTLLGWRIRNFYYLDNKFVESKAKLILKKDISTIEFKGFIEGYLSMGEVFNELYLIFKEHINRAIKINFDDNFIKQSLTGYITICYLRDYEDLKSDSLFYNLLYTWNSEYLIEIVKFMHNYLQFHNNKPKKAGKNAKKIVGKIMTYWEWSYNNREILKEKLNNKEYAEYYKQLGLFILGIDKLGYKEKKLIEYSKQYMQGWEFNSFIKYLTRYEDKNDLIFVDSLIEFYIEHGYFNIYKFLFKDNIHSICKSLRKAGLDDEVERIKNKFGEKGFYKFKDC